MLPIITKSLHCYNYICHVKRKYIVIQERNISTCPSDVLQHSPRVKKMNFGITVELAYNVPVRESKKGTY